MWIGIPDDAGGYFLLPHGSSLAGYDMHGMGAVQFHESGESRLEVWLAPRTSSSQEFWGLQMVFRRVKSNTCRRPSNLPRLA
jgi:hypothetical protein